MFKNRIVSAALIATAALAPTTSAFALPVAAGQSFDAKVGNVKAYANGMISVNFIDKMCDLNPNVAGDDDNFAVVSSAAAGRDQILSAATAALLSGKTVRVFVTDPSSGNCTIDSLMVLK